MLPEWGHLRSRTKRTGTVGAYFAHGHDAHYDSVAEVLEAYGAAPADTTPWRTEFEARFRPADYGESTHQSLLLNNKQEELCS